MPKELLYGYQIFKYGQLHSIGDGSLKIAGAYEHGKLIPAIKESILENCGAEEITTENIMISFLYENTTFLKGYNG